MTLLGTAHGARAIAVAGLVGLVGLLPATSAVSAAPPIYRPDSHYDRAYRYQVDQVQRDAHRLDNQLDDLRDAVLRTAHHEGDPYGGAQEMRFIMSVSALRGQADSLHYLLDNREPADVQVAFREMANLGAQIDRDIRSAHVTRTVAELWSRARNTLNQLGRDMYGNPRWDISQGGIDIFLPFPGGNSPWGNDHGLDDRNRDRDQGGHR